MAMDVAQIEGAEPWSSPGTGANGRIGAVVVHGFTGNPISVRALGERLAAEGYAVEVVRLPGHGTNVEDMATTRYLDWRTEVERAVRDLAERCDAVAVVGLSMGGTLAVDVATILPELVDGVMAINLTLLNRKGILPKLAPYLERLIPMIPAKLSGLVENDIAKGGDEKAYDKVPAAPANSLLAELPRIRAQVLDLKQPIVIAWSPQDHSVPCANSEALVELVGSDDVTTVVCERSYHLATMDHDAPKLEDAALELLAKIAKKA